MTPGYSCDMLRHTFGFRLKSFLSRCRDAPCKGASRKHSHESTHRPFQLPLSLHQRPHPGRHRADRHRHRGVWHALRPVERVGHQRRRDQALRHEAGGGRAGSAHHPALSHHRHVGRRHRDLPDHGAGADEAEPAGQHQRHDHGGLHHLAGLRPGVRLLRPQLRLPRPLHHRAGAGLFRRAATCGRAVAVAQSVSRHRSGLRAHPRRG